MTERELLAQLLLEEGILRFAPGEMPPLRWDGQAALEKEAVRTALLRAFLELIDDHYHRAEALLGGTWAELLARETGLPLNPGAVPPMALLVDELLLDGDALLERALPLRSSGVSIATAVVFNYLQASARARLDRADVRCHWLTDLETAAAVALQNGMLDFEEYDAVLAWED